MESCTKCGNPNVIIKRKASGQALCKDCFIESIEKKVKQTIKKENFIEKGDKVLVALSGGKDSVVTLEILNSYVKRHIIELCAVTIDEGIAPVPIAAYLEDGLSIGLQGNLEQPRLLQVTTWMMKPKLF